MATSYYRAGKDEVDLVNSVLRTFHPDLHQEELSVGVLMAVAAVDEQTGEPKGHALTHGGYPAAAKIRIVGTRDRALGVEDVVITIDSAHWDDLSNDQRIALIDHELTHIELVRDKNGAFATDDLGRPKLKMRKHDWQVGGFDSVVTKHGDNAPEVTAVREVMGSERPMRQLVMHWG